MVENETNICQLSFDGKYLYMSNEQYSVYFFKRTDTYLYVMDTDGNELNKIPTEVCILPVLAMSRMFLAQIHGAADKNIILKSRYPDSKRMDTG